jgi:two-component system response regulator PilR (NtrC family)
MSRPKRYVLIADDDGDNCFMLATTFRLSNCEVVTAGSVEEAKRLALGKHFDVCILDNLFRDGSGLELCRHLRESDPRAVVIFYSGAAYDGDREAGVRAGARAYIAKPFTDQLRAAVNTELSGTDCSSAATM